MSLYLVIDDSPLSRQALSWLIESKGHRSIAAGTVKEAIDQLSSEPTHVVLDLHLNDGSGTQVLKHIRANGMPIRVAVYSGTSDESVVDDALNLKADAIFRKPDWGDLMNWISPEERLTKRPGCLV